jgi:hypothetical protein
VVPSRSRTNGTDFDPPAPTIHAFVADATATPYRNPSAGPSDVDLQEVPPKWSSSADAVSVKSSRELPTAQMLLADEPLIALRLAPAGTPVTISDDHALPFQWISCSVWVLVVEMLPTAHTSLAEAAQTPFRPACVAPVRVGGVISFQAEPFHSSMTSPEPVSVYQDPTAKASFE